METMAVKQIRDHIPLSREYDFANLDLIREEWKKEAAKIKSFRVAIPGNIMSETHFHRYLEGFGAVAMIKQGDSSMFCIDDNNRAIIRNLYLYTIYDDKCEWNLDKGILLTGSIGTGKSVLMHAYTMILQKFAESEYGQKLGVKTFKFEPAQDIFNEIVANSGKLPLRLINSGLAIDELGREPKKSNSYGNEMNPLIDLLLNRYSNGRLTFGTSNFNLIDLSDPSNYGPVVGDRFKSMFNFIVMTGYSRRK